MEIEIRCVRPSDGQLLDQFYADLSTESLHIRFLGFCRALSSGLAATFCTLDHMHDEGFVALIGDGTSATIVGHVCLTEAGPGRVELGIAVSDSCQGSGIGRRLFEAAVQWAHERGYGQIVAACFATNSRVLRLLSSAPFGAEIKPAGSGVVEVSIPLIGPLPRYFAVYPPEARVSCRSRRPRYAASRRTPPPERAAAGSASRGWS